MKKLLMIACVSILFIAAQAQTIDEIIVGEWKITETDDNKSSKLNKKEQKQLKLLSKASLEFESDGHAKFKQIFSAFNIPDGFWEYNKEKDVIIINDWDKRNVTYMRLWYDIIDKDKLKLYVDETPYVLIAERKK